MRSILLSLLMLTQVQAAWSGRPCEEQAATTAQITQGMTLASRTAEQLNETGANVVVLARAGQDLSKYGLQWSHLGLAYKAMQDGRPVWRVLHKLNHCGTAVAALYRQGLGEFFLDRPHRYTAAYSVLSPSLQQALLPLLQDASRLLSIHESNYSMVAYPWATRYQQSNQWVIESIALASDASLQGRAAAQTWLKASGYQPSDMRLSTLPRLGARLSMANVAFDDHPSDRRFSGHIETITADSVFAWLPRAGLGGKHITISL